MDNLHTILRSIRSETKAGRDHRSVFREFLDHLDRISRARKGSTNPPKGRVSAHRRRRAKP
jgi:hypothetical protein